MVPPLILEHWHNQQVMVMLMAIDENNCINCRFYMNMISNRHLITI